MLTTEEQYQMVKNFCLKLISGDVYVEPFDKPIRKEYNYLDTLYLMSKQESSGNNSVVYCSKEREDFKNQLYVQMYRGNNEPD